MRPTGQNVWIRDAHTKETERTCKTMLAVLIRIDEYGMPIDSFIVAVGAADYDGIICLNQVKIDGDGIPSLTRTSVGPNLDGEQRRKLIKNRCIEIPGLSKYRLILY